MAITLITGTPGSGKTLYAVWLLQKELRAGRRLVVDGVRDLALEHELVDESWIRDWWNRCEHNDLIVIDEVQRIWPPQSVNVKPGPDVENLHVHRHKGVDFILITQHPQRLHKTIRDLVGRHVHVRRLFGLRQAMIYEWDHCHNPNAGFRDAVKTRWGYPKKIFRLYTSAELHTKQKAVIPKALFLIPLALLVAVFFGWRAAHGVLFDKGKAKSNTASVSGAAFTESTADGARVPVSDGWRVVGRYALGDQGYVLLADRHGRLRSELSDKFHGDMSQVVGLVDGQQVAVWSGGFDSAVAKEGAK